MKDRYLFRGKRVANDQFVNGHLLFADDYYHIIPSNSTEFNPAYSSKIYPETVGQCTGLKDKNGKLIFEGDVVKLTVEDYGHEGDLIWSSKIGEHGEVDVDPLGYDYSSTLLKWADCFDEVCCEIIGNIHDNPELLER